MGGEVAVRETQRGQVLAQQREVMGLFGRDLQPVEVDSRGICSKRQAASSARLMALNECLSGWMSPSARRRA